jgi:phospholipase D-like protein
MRGSRAIVVMAVVLLVAPSVALAADPISAHFLPQDGFGPILQLYRDAQRSISVATYVLSNESIASELIKAGLRGVKVRVLLDESQVSGNRYSVHSMLLKGSAEVRTVSPKMPMTNEFGVIDDRVLYTGSGLLHSDIKSNPKIGSYLIFLGDQGVVDRFRREFDNLFERGSRP